MAAISLDLSLIPNLGIPSPVFPGQLLNTSGLNYPIPTVPGLNTDPVLNPNTQGNSALQQFINQATSRDFAFQSKYSVTFPTTVGIVTQNPVDTSIMDAQTISLFCENAEMPGIQFVTEGFHDYGPDFQRPQQVIYQGEAGFQFLLDHDMGIRAYFESWMHAINNPGTYNWAYPDEYMSSGIVIRQLKRQGQDLQGGD